MKPSSTTSETMNMLDPYTWGQLTGTFSPESILGLQGLMGDWYRMTLGMINPQAQLAAGKDYLEKIAGPAATNSLTAAGLGRSGALGEAMANAGAQIALPITQQASQQAFNLNAMLPQLAMQALGMTTQQNSSSTTQSQSSNPMNMLLPIAMMAATPFLGPAAPAAAMAAPMFAGQPMQPTTTPGVNSGQPYYPVPYTVM